MANRYIEITSCKDCKHIGHSTNTHNFIVTFFCTNPINSNVEAPREEVNKTYYPITQILKGRRTLPMGIPMWCKLPSKVI